MADIAETIRALLAKSQGTDNEHEAAAFAAKAAELLQKHNLDLASVEAAARTTGEAVSEVKLDWRYTDPWRMSIVRDTARLYFCRIYTTRRVEKDGKGRWVERKGVAIVGKPHNTAVAVSMTEYLVKTTLRLAAEYSTERGQRLPFERGCGERIAQRLRTIKYEQELASARDAGYEDAASASSNPGNLPALYKSELVLVEDFMATLGLVPGRRSTGSSLDGHHAAAGRRAGDTVSLSTQIGGRSSHLIGRGKP